MSVKWINRMVVYGARTNLERFRKEMAGDYQNGPISFNNIILQPGHKKGLENIHLLSLELWRQYNWGCISDALWPELTEKEKFLDYTFFTYLFCVRPVYDAFIVKYYDLKFIIGYNCETDGDWNYIIGKEGEIKEEYFLYWECSKMNKKKYKDIQYKKDLIKNTTEIVQINVFHPNEYDEAYHQWINKTI